MRLTAVCVALVATLSTIACGSNSSPSPRADDIPSLQTIDVSVGSGAQASPGQRISVHYTLFLYSSIGAGNRGTRIESSRDRGAPFSFALGTGAVIAGWDQGIPGMRVGGSRTLLIPSALAYGSRGSGNVPPNSALVFDVELISIP
jgi:FKBP-type peptidyl-prolyl cis-trans isomerase FkpA